MKKALEAAYRVLSEAGKPLHYKEITRLALKKGYWHTDGKTPEATINGQIANDIKKRGKESRFRRDGRGVFALLSTKPTDSGKGLPRRRGPQPAGTLSFTDAAEKILKQSPNRKALHYKEITRKALKLGLIKTAGRTPEATMRGAIYQECQRRDRRGEPQRFDGLPRGKVALSKWQPTGLTKQIVQHNRDVRKRLLQALNALTPVDFEALVGQLLTALGFENVEVTKLHKDGGIDARGVLVVGDSIRIKMAVQAKKWNANVPAPQVQQVRGSLGVHDQGLIITTSDFSSGAAQEANRPDGIPVGLMNGTQLVALLIEHQIGVRRTAHDVLKLALDGLSDASEEGR